MNIQQEEITIKEFTTGNTLVFFSTHLNVVEDDFSEEELIPTMVWLNGLNQPYKITSFRGDTLWAMDPDNNSQLIQELENNFITGHSIVKDYNFIIEEERFVQIEENFTKKLDSYLIVSGSTGPQITPHTDYIFRKTHEVDDFYVNVNLKRSYGTLNTLDIYNNLTNSYPTQEADTGIVFGRLVALQNIKDAEGNNIKIPLRNVPIGIFNPSDDFPNSSSIDENGDRLYLNSKESSTQNQYFNSQSWSADTENYLRSTSQFVNVPDQYKYITTTNENGEFIIYNAPIGTQIVVFEVDLFKQGLTKDEIALNFFPFPPDNDSILDQFPSLVFKQFPVDVVPAWGTSQTGYTELNITINMDLRKWATFYIPPVAYEGNKIGSLELLQFSPTLNVDIRDMSREGFPTSRVPVVEIQDVLDKDDEHTLLWNNEFAQLKSTVKFLDHGFKAFKVRANMYDPYGFKTDSNGNPMSDPSQQGVWLAGYQFKLYYNEPNTTFRTTGFQRDWGFTSPSWRGRDNFHLNRGEGSDAFNTDTGPQSYPPYDRPWSHLYPEPYKIPSRPTRLNFNRFDIGSRLTDSNGNAYLEQPLYLDGDEVGFPISSIAAGGFGAQYSSNNQIWFANRFSKEVTSRFVYKYESGVAWNETYSNGYRPSLSSFEVQPGVSRVENGEKYQRVECGYGYWLRPDGWPPISVQSWGDVIFAPSTTPGVTLDSSTFGPGVLNSGTQGQSIIVQAGNQFVDVYNIDDLDLCLALDANATFSEGGLNIYRIVDPNQKVPPGPNFIPTFATYNFQDFYFQRGRNQAQRLHAFYDDRENNRGDQFFSKLDPPNNTTHAFVGYSKLRLEIRNKGTISISIPNTNVTLGPNQAAEFDAIELGLSNGSITLPGNSNYNFNTNQYMDANYDMTFKNVTINRRDGTLLNGPYNVPIVNTRVDADISTSIPDYYLVSRYRELRTAYNGNTNTCRTSRDIPDRARFRHSVDMDGALFNHRNSGGGGSFLSMRFSNIRVVDNNPTCIGRSGWNFGKHSITIKVL